LLYALYAFVNPATTILLLLRLTAVTSRRLIGSVFEYHDGFNVISSLNLFSATG
jgi:hypothetical protein